jgi:hypothetical protein
MMQGRITMESSWDTVESGVPNVFLLRNRNFEKYFQTDGDNCRPAHWPKAWTDKAVIWNSVGSLWANNDSLQEEDSGETTTLENDTGEDASSMAQNPLKMPILEEKIQKIRNDFSWDYLVVYFDQCPIDGGGFFDGVCTVSLRKPKHGDDKSPYLVIGALATEKCLSEEENERVTKGIIGAVVGLGKKILEDFVEKQQESIWYRAFGHHSEQPAAGSLLVCIAFEAQDVTLEKLVINDDHDENDADFLSFWKDKIGFQEPSKEVTLKVLGKYKTLFSKEYRYCSDDESKKENKKRKKSSHLPPPLSEAFFEEGATPLSTSSSSDEGIICEDGDDNKKKSALLEEFASKIKLLVISAQINGDPDFVA